MNMANPKTSDADTVSAPSSTTVLLLVGTVADTTWRLFVPTIGGTILGIWLDHTFDTRPWATVVCVIIGTAISLGLIYLQIRKVQK